MAFCSNIALIPRRRTLPRQWKLANGEKLHVSQYYPLFSLLGTTYGGDSRTTFALPSLEEIGGCLPIICVEGEYDPSLQGKLEYLQLSEDDLGHKIGMIIKMKDEAPTNYIPCDGRTLKVMEYQELFQFLGHDYGGALDIFALPNLNDLGEENYMIVAKY